MGLGTWNLKFEILDLQGPEGKEGIGDGGEVRVIAACRILNFVLVKT